MASAVVQLALVLACVHGQPVVDTEYGPVRGHIVPDVFNGKDTVDVTSFLGVPYAASTAGDNRFRNPQPHEPWTEIFEADTLGQSCPQNHGSLTSLTHPNFTNYGEDCLNSAIFTPTDLSRGPYPVMVWYHGGAFTGGTNIQYPGHFLATYDIVVVVPNYRLNDFGFSFTADDAIPGNAGLWDQNANLQWVKRNIANFGGDPGKVTIFGQSAGSASSSLHIVSPHSPGLFHQAIMESGAEDNFWSINTPEAQPENYTRELAADVNCTQTDTFEMVECMREVPWQDLVDARFRCTPGFFCQGMAPVVDGPGGFLPEKPADLRQSGNFMDIPIIAGICEDDGSFYTVSMIPESLLGGFSRRQFGRYIYNRLLNIWAALLTDQQKRDAFYGVMWQYTPWPYVNNEYANRDYIDKLITDAAFGMRWDRQLKNQSPHAPSYGYLFGYRGRTSADVVPEWMGVPHAGEIPYTWGWPLLQFNQAVRDDSGILEDFIPWTMEDAAYTTFWNELYANFAHTGNPTPTPVEAPNNLGPITWSPYSEEAMNVLYVYNETVEIVAPYNQKNYAFFHDYAPYVWQDAPIPIRMDDGAAGLPSDLMAEMSDLYYSVIGGQEW